MSASADQITDGTLLGGRVIYRQRQAGYRTGIEPVLLAASVPARPGDRVLEGGTGAGAGLLCLAARIAGSAGVTDKAGSAGVTDKAGSAGVTDKAGSAGVSNKAGPAGVSDKAGNPSRASLFGLGIEIDPDLAGLARDNLRANGFDQLEISTADLTAWAPGGVFDHAFANPPWHPADGTASPDHGRRTAKIAPPGSIASWARHLAAGLRRRGTLSLILPAAAATEGMSALSAAGCGEIDILPLWPHAGSPARLVILRGVRDGSGGDRVLPGLVLHERGGGYTAEADAILRAPNTLV